MGARRDKADVGEQQTTVLELQRYVWGRLPIRKYLCGHSRVFDIVAVLIQEWPFKAIDNSQSGDTAEVHALEDLAHSCKRHLGLTYGEPEWDMWSSTMKHVIWQSIWVLLHWYRQSRENRAVLLKIGSKWRNKKG
jgi:hypothetical protein